MSKRVKRDVAMAQAGIPRGVQNGLAWRLRRLWRRLSRGGGHIWVWGNGKSMLLPNGGFAIRYSIVRFAFQAASDRNLNSPPAKLRSFRRLLLMLTLTLPMAAWRRSMAYARNPDPVSAFQSSQVVTSGRWRQRPLGVV